MPHHRVPDYDDFLKAAENLAYFFRSEPPHITTPRYVGSIEANSPTGGHRGEHTPPIGAQGGERGMEVEGRYIADSSELVRLKRVYRVVFPIKTNFRSWKSCYGSKG
jgi:hypothetical protein